MLGSRRIEPVLSSRKIMLALLFLVATEWEEPPPVLVLVAVLVLGFTGPWAK